MPEFAFCGQQGGAFGFLHDLAVTHDYYILLQNPTRLNFRKLLFEYIPGGPSLCSNSYGLKRWQWTCSMYSSASVQCLGVCCSADVL